MLPAAYKMEPETPRVSGADELDRCIERVAMCDRDAFAVLYRSTSGAVFASPYLKTGRTPRTSCTTAT